jgi:hypothetical protein
MPFWQGRQNSRASSRRMAAKFFRAMSATAIYAGMKPRERIEVLLALLGAERRLELSKDAVEAATR